VSTHQGIRILFSSGARIIFRLSGTGTAGATLRMYVEAYEAELARLDLPVQQVLEPFVSAALQLSQLKELTGRSEPTVIT
jgi:phosphoglucomutase